MSAKLSSASPASAGASITRAKAAPTAGAATGAGNGTSDVLSAAVGVRGSSGGGAGPGSGSRSGAGFSSAMADAAKADDQAVSAAGTADGGESIDTYSGANYLNNPDYLNNPNSSRVGANERSREILAADVTGGGSATVIAGAQGGANALPTVEANAAKSNSTVLGQTGDARVGVKRVRSDAARAAGRDDASKVTTDPVALAMLLAASAMQMNSGAGASTVVDGSSSLVNAADGGKPALGATGVANAPSTALDAVSSALSAGGGLPGAPAPSQGKIENFDSSAGQRSIMMGSAALPELVRGFTTAFTQTPVVEATISVPLASGGWPHAVAAQVHWFVNNDVHSATLRLSPEHLGPIEVHIDVRHSQVNVNFTAAHAETRVALEQTVPRLREIFASGGLTLGQASVQQDPRSGSQPSAVAVRSALAHAQTVEPVAVAAAHALGLVDEYV